MNLDLGNHGSRSSDLIDKMSAQLESLDISLRIIKLQSANTRQVEAGHSSKLASLPQEEFLSFSVDKLLSLEKDYSLHHYEFVGLILSWISEMGGNMRQKSARKLWKCLQPFELSVKFMSYFPSYLLDVQPACTLFNVTISPKNQVYRYRDSTLYSNWESPEKGKLETIPKADLDDFALHGKEVLFSKRISCTKPCGIKSDLKLKLVKDQIPCYKADPENLHFTIKHIFIASSSHGCISLCRPYEIVSGYLEKCLKVEDPKSKLMIYCMFETKCFPKGFRVTCAGRSKKRKLEQEP